MSKQTRKNYQETLHLDMPFAEALQRFSNVNVRDMDIVEDTIKSVGASPFVKWVGGKRSVIEELKSRMPESYNGYWEPFIGGGALFFDLAPKMAHISDANFDLIMTYKVIQKDVHQLIDLLKIHQKKHSEDYYYKIRSQHNLTDPIEIAGRMIYLNKTCFNGLFRVNRKGEFNTPIGNKVVDGTLNTGIVREDNLLACHKALKGVDIKYIDYSKINAQAGDFVYFDPPYHPMNATSFTSYSMFDFTDKDQLELSEFCTSLHRKGVKFMLSNSHTPYILDLYKSNIFKIAIINAPRVVNCKPNGRNAVEEVLITNY